MEKHCDNPWFDLIKSGKKKVEGRLANGCWKEIKIGEYMTFYNEQQKVCRRVTDKVFYETFEGMLIYEGISNVLPGIFDIGKGVKVYRKYFSEDDEKAYGVVAVHLI